MMERAVRMCLALLALGLSGVTAVAAAPGGPPPRAERQAAVGAEAPQALRALVPDGPRTVLVDAAGLTKSGRRMWAIEPVGAGDPKRPKLVLVGGLDGDPASTAIVMRVLNWWFADRAAAALRAEWQIAALPCARPDSCGEAPVTAADAPFSFPPPGGFFDGKLDPTPHYVWRWTTMQAPTVVIDVRAGKATSWSANAASAGILPECQPRPELRQRRQLPARSSAPLPTVEPARRGRCRCRPSVSTRPLTMRSRRSRGCCRERRGSPRRFAPRWGHAAARAPLDVARLLAPNIPGAADHELYPRAVVVRRAAAGAHHR